MKRKKLKRKRSKLRTPEQRTSVYLNGRLTGFHENGRALITELRSRRRGGSLSSEVNFFYNQKTDELFINSDSGRARRPYIVVENGQSRLTSALLEQLKKNEISWTQLVKLGVIEYLDAEEEESAYVCLKEIDLL